MAKPSVTIDPDLLRTVESRYGPITLFVNDTSAVGLSLQLYGEWAENEIGFLRRFIRSSMTVLDVGAFIGTHALAFGRAVGPTGVVWAFEAQPTSFALLDRNITAGGLRNIRLVNAAVADRQGSVTIPAIDPAQAGSFGSATLNDQLRRRSQAGLGNTAQAVTVKAVTIDSLDLQACDLMKIDVEGTEDIVLRGAASTIKRLKPIVYAECNSVANGLAAWNVLREFGYEVRLHLVDAFVAKNFFHAEENIFGACREAALVGVPAEKVSLLDSYEPRPCELLVKLADADDLVLGLLNKPQYPDEILRPSAAAADGADAWLREGAQLRAERHEWEEHARTARAALSSAQEELSSALRRAQAERGERDTLLSERDSQLSERDRQLSERDRQLSKRDGQLSERDRQLSEGDQRLSETARRLAETDKQLSESDQRLSETARWLAESDQRLSETARRLVEKDKQLSESDQRLSETAKGLLEKDKQLSDQEILLSEYQQQLTIHVARASELVAEISTLQAREGLRNSQIAKFEEDFLQRSASIFFKPFREIMRIERQARGLFRRRRLPEEPRGVARPVAEPDEEAEPGPLAADAIAAPISKPVTFRTRSLELADSEARHPTLGEDSGSRPLLICLSHILPWPPRAGNELLTHRMLSWFKGRGWDVVLLYCPLPGEEPTPTQVAEACREYDNLVLVGRGGLISHRLGRRDVSIAVSSLEGRQTRDIARLIREAADGPISRLYVPIRTFCPDVQVEAALALDEALSPRVVLANYVFMTRGLQLLKSGAIRAVQSHDVFSTKAEKVVQFGIEDSLAMSAAEEGHLLAPVDLVLSVQSDEAKELRKLAPHAKVLQVGIDMPVIEASEEPVTKPVVLMVASGNAMNTKGLRDFLRYAWPVVRREVPDAELHVVGSVGESLADEPGVKRLGYVAELGPAYAAARLVINPAVAGTGLKIKTLEALAHLRPIVLWPSGVDGMSDELGALCVRATDWYAFTEAVIQLLRDDAAQRRITLSRDRIAELMSPETVFVELDRALGGAANDARNSLRVAAQ